MEVIGKELKDVCEKCKNDFDERKRVYKEIIDGEVKYIEGHPPKRVGVRYVSLPHGLVEVKKIRLGFAMLEIICESVK